MRGPLGLQLPSPLAEPPKANPSPPPEESNSYLNEKPVLLELFSGTGSVGRSFRARWWECIWASPPCTHYSRARTKAKTPRDLEGSDAIVQKVLDIIEWYETGPWFMENPHSGLLKSREVVDGLLFKVVDYCKYGKPYRKRTAIWTNTYWKPQQPLCKHDCPVSSGSRHTARAQQGTSSATDVRYSRDELYSIPPALCDEIADYATSRYLRGLTHS